MSSIFLETKRLILMLPKLSDQYNLMFRDYLLAHNEVARKYEQLKIKLAAQYPYDREQYTQEKTEFITDILKKAKEEVFSVKNDSFLDENLKPILVPATLDDYQTIQNMARFYVYDMSRYCGLFYHGWEFPANGLYECNDFKKYFEDPTCRAFLIKVSDELAGFVLINKICSIETVDWNMGEFFILAKFQRSGLGTIVANETFKKFPGK